MRRPKLVQIMGDWYEIKYHKEFIDVEGTPSLGAFHPDMRMIEIKADRNWRLHLWHEVLHGIMFMSGMSQILGDNEEAVVRAIENGGSPLINLHLKSKRFRY